MYRRRRLAVVVVALLVVGAGIGLALWRPWEAFFAAVEAAAPSPSAPSTRATPVGTPSGSPTPSPTASDDAEKPSPSPTPTTSGEAIPVCTSGDVTVQALLDRDSYGGDQKPQLSIEMTNEGDVACAMNVGTSAQSFTIASGTDVWWRSTDCQTEPSDQIVQLEPGQTVKSAEPLVWDRTRSSVSSCDDDRPRALAGYYNLVVSVGGIESGERQFRLR